MDRPLATLTPEQKKIVHEFGLLFYERWRVHTRTWLGWHMVKYPTDLIVYQMMIFEKKPDIIIESGSGKGGGSLFFASICELMGRGSVISIDKRSHELMKGRPSHNRLEYIIGSSVRQDVIEKLAERVKGRTCMIVLDSDHTSAHVKNELHRLNRFVTDGQYIVAEDTYFGGNPIMKERFHPGPMAAVDWFVAVNRDFTIDNLEDYYLVSMNPRGWLRRLQGNPTNA